MTEESIMIYATAIIGFLMGFALALKILAYLLRDRSRDDLLKDSSLRITYGLLAWAIAARTAAASSNASTSSPACRRTPVTRHPRAISARASRVPVYPMPKMSISCAIPA